MLLLLPTIPCSLKIRSVCTNARAHNYPSDDGWKQNDQPYRSRCLIIHTMLSLLVHFSLKQRRARRLHAPSLTLLPSSLTPERSHHDPFGCLLLPPPRRCIRRGRGRPPRLRHITPSTRHDHWPEYTCRRGAPGARQSGGAARRAHNGAGRGCGAWCRRRRRRMPRRRSQLLFLSGVLVVPSLAGFRLAGGRPCRWTRPPGADGIPNTVRLPSTP